MGYIFGESVFFLIQQAQEGDDRPLLYPCGGDGT